MQVATGTGETGAALVDNVDMIMFTGSTRTGKKVMARAAERLIPVSLELGGKDPMIVLRDADVERAANMAVQWAMSNSGQICIAVERVYVEEPVYDEFVDEGGRRRSRACGRACPASRATSTSARSRSRRRSRSSSDHVQDAVDKGAQVLVGGQGRRRARAASSSRRCSPASTTR